VSDAGLFEPPRTVFGGFPFYPSAAVEAGGGPGPPNGLGEHVGFAPFEELFPRSALVVHHGGIGTIALALAAGVPQIVRPMMGAQFDLGNRMQRLGVGRMITGECVT